ncbi:MAG TPA: lytic transglycosylase domain-containing protein [Pseudolabrys sp.]|nr:lytic transglycosylase domain-containing protein [Pseudolabrys sp.]
MRRAGMLAPFGDIMRHLFLPACICLMTLSGAAGADEIPPETVSATKSEDSVAPAPAAETPAGEFQDQSESSPPKTGAAEPPPVAADVPMPIKRPPPIKDRVVARSHQEICTSVAESAHSNDLPLPFFIRLLFQESGFKPDVVSRAGAQGIAQFMPETAATVGLNNPFDPTQAIAASARLLGDLVRRFGNLGLAAAAYNAGPRRIQDWLAKKGKLPEETKHYVKTITGRPAETWKGRVRGRLAAALPREAPCQERVTFIVAKAAGPSVRRTAAAAKTPAIIAERKSAKTRGKGGKGAIQLAAASKKEGKRKGSRH